MRNKQPQTNVDTSQVVRLPEFHKHEVVSAKIIKGMERINSKIIDIRPEFGRFIFWLAAIENKGKIIEGEIFIAEQDDLKSYKLLEFDF